MKKTSISIVLALLLVSFLVLLAFFLYPTENDSRWQGPASVMDDIKWDSQLNNTELKIKRSKLIQSYQQRAYTLENALDIESDPLFNSVNEEYKREVINKAIREGVFQ